MTDLKKWYPKLWLTDEGTNHMNSGSTDITVRIISSIPHFQMYAVPTEKLVKWILKWNNDSKEIRIFLIFYYAIKTTFIYSKNPYQLGTPHQQYFFSQIFCSSLSRNRKKVDGNIQDPDGIR